MPLFFLIITNFFFNFFQFFLALIFKYWSKFPTMDINIALLCLKRNINVIMLNTSLKQNNFMPNLSSSDTYQIRAYWTHLWLAQFANIQSPSNYFPPWSPHPPHLMQHTNLHFPVWRRHLHIRLLHNYTEFQTGLTPTFNERTKPFDNPIIWLAFCTNIEQLKKKIRKCLWRKKKKKMFGLL